MKRATIRTHHADPNAIATALRPDNTAAMETTVVGETVETTIERETTGGLGTTVDDYLVNLTLAAQLRTDRQTDTHTSNTDTTTRQ